MQLPLEIKVRDGGLPEPLMAEIRERAEGLDRFYGRIMRCRVIVEGPGPHHRSGFQRLRILLTVPGKEIVVTRQSGEDLAEAIREAFGAATRRLEDHIRKARGYAKAHEATPQARVSKIFPERDYGFLEDPTGREIYFHRNSLVNVDFDRLKVGSEVRFAEETGDEGPQATSVLLSRARR